MVKKYKNLTVIQVAAKISKTKTAIIGLVAASILVVGLTHRGWFIESILENRRMGSLARIPLIWVENLGQWDRSVQFIARRQGFVAYLLKNEVILQLKKHEDEDQVKGVVVRMVFEGILETVKLKGEEQQPGVYNFFLGNDPSKWRSEVSGYARVVYRSLYKGVDLCLREENGWLEYDLLLAEGADLNQVVIHCDGIKGLEIGPGGSLVMESEFGSITQKAPRAWYELPTGERLSVKCRFRKLDGHRYGFEVPEHDLNLALVIDPQLEWSTFFGGSGNDEVMTLALDSSGTVTVAGYTESSNFPTTPGAYDTTYNGGTNDGFVARLSADGTQLFWSTYFGGSDVDILFQLTVDDSDWITVAGLTRSPDFPTTEGAFDTTHNGSYDAVVARLSGDGTELIYSTYLGDYGEDWILALAVDSSGEAIVGGYTSSPYFPATPYAYDTTYNGGSRDAFVARLNNDGTELIYSTFLGGGAAEGLPYYYPAPGNMAIMDLALSSSGDVIVIGVTFSLDFPTTSYAYDRTHNGIYDAFVTRLNANGSDLICSTFLGGSSADGAVSIAVNELGEATIGGFTYSSDFPSTPGAYDTTFNGGLGFDDAFVARLDTAGSNLLYSTFIGGFEWDGVYDLTLDVSDDVIITGFCGPGFPTTPAAYDTTFNGHQDVFLSRISLDGNGEEDLLYSTFIGYSDYEGGNTMALVADSTVILAGYTHSFNFPITAGAHDTTHNGATDGFICLVEPFIRYPNLSIDDFAILDTLGNDDGRADPGERVEMFITLFNSHGFRDADSVSMTLTTDDTSFTFVDSVVLIPYIPAGSTQSNQDNPFIFDVLPCSSHWANFQLMIHAQPNDYSKTENFHIVIGRPSLIVVDDDQGADYEEYYFAALDSLGVLYDCSNWLPVDPYLEISKYEAIIWFTGDDSITTLTQQDIDSLSSWLDNGGKLFITGQDIGYDIGSDTFYLDYLHSQFVSDDTPEYGISGVDGDPIGDGLIFSILGGDGANNQTSPDVVLPFADADSCFRYRYGQGICGVHYEDQYKVVYLSFGFEGIYQFTERKELMSRILAWFGYPVTEAADKTKLLTQEFPRLRVSPNPFKSVTKIFYFLSTKSRSNLRVYDSSGRYVHTLVDRWEGPGLSIVEWRGRDFRGMEVPSGTYFLQFQSPYGTFTKKIVHIR